MNPLCAKHLPVLSTSCTGFSLKAYSNVCHGPTDYSAHVLMTVCGVGAWPTIPLCTIPCMLCRRVPVVTTEQSSVPATISPSEGKDTHGSFTTVSAWVAVRVT